MGRRCGARRFFWSSRSQSVARRICDDRGCWSTLAEPGARCRAHRTEHPRDICCPRHHCRRSDRDRHRRHDHDRRVLRRGGSIGSDASSPYSVTWTNVPAGTYSLTARARDNAAASTTSLAKNVTVTAAPTRRQRSLLPRRATARPSLRLRPSPSARRRTTPTARSRGWSSGQGSTLIGSDTTAPYGTSWNNVPAGPVQPRRRGVG